MKAIVNVLAVLLMLTLVANVQATTIIGGSTGDGDFEEAEPASGPLWYTAHSSWFNASGSEGINFSNDSQTGGSSQANSRAGMPFNDRHQVNGTGYTITAAGEVFSLSYDFGAGGGPAAWNGDEVMKAYLFTSTVAVDGNVTTADMTEVAADNYAINRAQDGQWTTRNVPVLYTSTAGDIGKTVYLGTVFDQGTGTTLFPRLDVVQLDVTVIPEPATLALVGIACLSLGLQRRKLS